MLKVDRGATEAELTIVEFEEGAFRINAAAGVLK
jgi:hypothetical protein